MAIPTVAGGWLLHAEHVCVVDHHPAPGDIKPDESIIEPVGSATTILVERIRTLAQAGEHAVELTETEATRTRTRAPTPTRAPTRTRTRTLTLTRTLAQPGGAMHSQRAARAQPLRASRRRSSARCSRAILSPNLEP